MSQKQARFISNRTDREDKLIDGYKKPRRPILFSSDDVQRMQIERARAKLMRQLVSKPPDSSGEFSSYFYGPKKQNDPVYSITTHKTNEHEPPNGFVVPTYPSFVNNNVRWNPEIQETSVFNCQTNKKQYVEESSNYICRCNQCTGKHCRGQPGGENKPHIFRDNITRFADNSTMTLKLYDACCGSCTPVKTPRNTSDVSISSSDIAVKEDHDSLAGISQVYMKCDPVSILKKERCEGSRDYEQEDDENYCVQQEKKCRIADDFQEAVRDTEEDMYYELSNSKPMRSFPKVVRNKNRDSSFDDNEPRKSLYNEGISDLTINLLPTAPVYPGRFQSAKKLKSDYSRTFLRNGYQSRDGTPFSNSTGSKYHYSCGIPQIKPYYYSNDIIEHQTLPQKFRKTYSSKPMPYNNTESVRFPRKVLTSERDIESYIGGRFMNESCNR